MRRLMLGVICALLLLASSQPASAGWGHLGGWHHGWHHGWRSYASHWHRPYHHHHYAHRHFYRSYVPRIYAYPSFSFSYGYTARPYYYPSRYYTPYYASPYCASATPTYYSPSYSTSSLALARRTTTTAPAARRAFDTSSLARVAERVISEVAASRTALKSPAASRTLGRAPETTPRARAMSLVEIGDEYFRSEQYQYALAYYEAATKTDANSAEADYRQALAGIATGRYDKAVKALKRGVDNDPSFLASTFRLNQIYKNEQRQTQHVEALAGVALEKSTNPDAYFLIGAFLHFEGSRDRAEKFLQRASDLSAGSGSHARVFLAASRRSRPLVMTSVLSSNDTAGPF